MKNAIVIKVVENLEKVELSTVVDVNISEYTKYYVIEVLMKCLKMSVDWDNSSEVARFASEMALVCQSSNNVVEEV